MNEDIIDLLDKHNWGESILKLTAYAVYLYGLKTVRLPKGLEPEDLVMDAIEKVYKGIRKWDPEADPDLHQFLMSVVKSILSNETRSADNRVQTGRDYGEAEQQLVSGSAEEELYAKELDQQISAAMRGDPELCLVYKALKDGFRPGEIAEEYALEISTVRNAQKRLSRLVYRVIHSPEQSLLHEPA